MSTKDSDDIQKLIKTSKDAYKNSYAPYSKVRVGAALLCADGTIYTGCNVENVAFTVGICAERTAVAKAVSEGRKSFKSIAIASNLDEYIAPCGACRQFLVEFGTELDVYMSRPDLSYRKKKILELLPDAFLPPHASKFSS